MKKLYKLNLTKQQKRTFCVSSKKEGDKNKKEYDEMADTNSQSSSESDKSKQLESKVDKGKGKQSAIDDTSDNSSYKSKGKGRAVDGILDSSSQESSGSNKSHEDKGKQAAYYDPQSPGKVVDNTLDNSSQESETSSVFDIPDQLKTKQISMYQGNPGRGAGGPSTRPYLSDDESSGYSVTSSQLGLWAETTFRRNIYKKLWKGEDIHDNLGILRSSRRNSVSEENENFPYEDTYYPKANSEGSTVNKYDLAELNLQVEKSLKLSTKKSEIILQERDHMFDATIDQILNPRFTLSQLSLSGTSTKSKSESDSEKSENSKAVLFYKGGSGGGPGGSNSGGGSSGTGGYGGPTGSGTVHFILENLDELGVILPFLLGIISTMIAINPEILMYFRLIITLIRNPAFKLYFYFKYLYLLSFLNKIKKNFCLFCTYLFRLVKIIFTFIFYPLRNLTTIGVSSVIGTNNTMLTKRIGWAV